MFKIGDRVKYVGKVWTYLKNHPGTVKSIIYSPSKTYEDLTVVVLFDGENTPRHTYVTSLSDINDHN